MLSHSLCYLHLMVYAPSHSTGHHLVSICQLFSFYEFE